MELSIPKERTLFGVAHRCLELFEKCLVQSKRQQKQLVHELQARFNLWAAYTGVFANDDMSLDSRLLLHPDVKRMTLNLLDMVERNLKNALMTHTNYDSTVSIHSERFCFDEHSSLSKVLETQGSSFRGLAAVPVALDRLHRLATAIRRSSLESRKEKLLSKIWDSDHDTYLGECIYRLVQGRFPNARASLLKQLTAAICSQRRKLLYLPKHNKKLEVQKPSHQHISSQRAPLQESLHLPLPLPPVNHLHGHVCEQPMSVTDASIPNSIQLRRLLGRVIKPAVSVASTGSAIQGESLLYPEAPVFAPGEKLHPCPYCSEPLPTSKMDLKVRSNVDYWRTHVNQDLEPYFCLSEECKEPLKFFIHYSDWLDHMSTSHTDEWFRSAHMLTWYCDLGHAKRELFVDRESFESHTKDSHPNLTTSQLRARAKKSKTVALREPLVCPLCECVPPKLSVISSQHQNSKESRAVLCKHIGFHLKALSLMSFRLVLSEQDTDQMEDNVAEEPSTEMSTTRMLRSIQDDFVDSDENVAWLQAWPYSALENNDAEMTEHGLETMNADPGAVDWSQLPGFGHLSESQTMTPLDGIYMPELVPRQDIRGALGIHADEITTSIIQSSEGLERLSLPHFLVHVLLEVRKRFLIGNEPGKLVLEDMKWINDNKVRPLKIQLLQGKFYCNLCDFIQLQKPDYGFDELLQHIVARHSPMGFSENGFSNLDKILWTAELPFSTGPRSAFDWTPQAPPLLEREMRSGTDSLKTNIPPTVYDQNTSGEWNWVTEFPDTQEGKSWRSRAGSAPNPNNFFDPGEDDLTSSFWGPMTNGMRT